MASVVVLILGVAGLVAVPVFKTYTHLPPYMGNRGLGINRLFGGSRRRHLDDRVMLVRRLLSNRRRPSQTDRWVEFKRDRGQHVRRQPTFFGQKQPNQATGRHHAATAVICTRRANNCR